MVVHLKRQLLREKICCSLLKNLCLNSTERHYFCKRNLMTRSSLSGASAPFRRAGMDVRI